MIDKSMMRRLLSQCGMETAVMDDATMRLAKAIFAAGMAEERAACAALCEEAVVHPPGYGGVWEGYGPVKTQRDGKGCAAAIRMRSNV